MIKIPTNDNYFEMTEKFPCKGDAQSCVVCGRPCLNSKYMVWVHNGGIDAVTAKEGEALNEEGSDGDLGMHPVGSDCLKRHPELKPYVFKK